MDMLQFIWFWAFSQNYFVAVFGSKLGEQKRNPKNGTIPIIL
jgi:hypothetical protein